MAKKKSNAGDVGRNATALAEGLMDRYATQEGALVEQIEMMSTRPRMISANLSPEEVAMSLKAIKDGASAARNNRDSHVTNGNLGTLKTVLEDIPSGGEISLSPGVYADFGRIVRYVAFPDYKERDRLVLASLKDKFHIS